MPKNRSKTYCFIFNNNFEKLIESYYTPEIFDGINNHGLTKIQPLGTCLCSLLNSIDALEKLDDDIKNNISKYIISNDVATNLSLIYKKLISISKYFYITEFEFYNCMANIKKAIQENTNTNIYNIYQENINYVLSQFIGQIMEIMNFIKSKHRSTIYIPSSIVNCKFGNTVNNGLQYTYHVANIYDLLRVSYYQILISRIHIRKCSYPNCTKYFITTRGQTRYCENPCPDNPSETCRSIKKNINHNLDCEDWEINLSDLEKQLNRIRTRFYDNINNKNITQRKREVIFNNKEKLKEIVKELKRRIKGNSSKERMYYLKIYEEFLNEVETNLNLSPSVFKIKKPNY